MDTLRFFIAAVLFAMAATAAQGANTAPFIAGVANQTQASSAVIGPLGFVVADAETAAGSLTVRQPLAA